MSIASNCASISSTLSSLIVVASGNASIKSCTSFEVIIETLFSSFSKTTVLDSSFVSSSNITVLLDSSLLFSFTGLIIVLLDSSITGTYILQSSRVAPSLLQTGQSTFIDSSLHCVSQIHSSVSSNSSCAKTLAGARENNMHRESRILSIRFLILIPPYTARIDCTDVYAVNKPRRLTNQQVVFLYLFANKVTLCLSTSI